MLTSRTSDGRSNARWLLCFLLFLATTINYMDRQVFALVEPLLHRLPFMGWTLSADAFHQPVYDNHYGNIVICFQIAYGLGMLFAGRIVDKLGTRRGYALAIFVWAVASVSHSLAGSVLGFCLVRILLGLGESGNFPAALKATSEYFPTDQRALATGLFNSGSNAASLIAPALVAFVTVRYGWRAAFLTTGSMGLVWLVLWLAFPYQRFQPATMPDVRDAKAAAGVGARGLAPQTWASGSDLTLSPSAIFSHRGLYAYAAAKALTDGVWWFYLFYLPQFLNRNYGLSLGSAYWYIATVYLVSSIGSIAGGGLSGLLMDRGRTLNTGRKTAMFVTALCVVPVVFVPHLTGLFPHNAWPATALFALAAAAHQGWSANLFSTPGDLFPSRIVSTVVGIGGAAGAAGGAAFTWIVKHQLSPHPLLIFSMAAGAYLLALLIFHLLVPRVGGSVTPT